MRPGLTTTTQPSGAPLPLPMRVSCGFLVIGLSGNTRIQILPPRLIPRAIATRAASIWRSVIQHGSSAMRPKSPNATVCPRYALPRIRPRCCFLYLTFFGINMTMSPSLFFLSPSGFPLRPRRATRLTVLFFAADARRQPLALVEPHLDANRPVGREGLREPIIHIRPQRLQRQLAVQIPFGPRDFRAVQPAGHPHLDPLGAEPQRRFDGLAHRTAERHALFELHRHRLADELGIQFRLLDLEDVDEHLAAGHLGEFLPKLVHLRALAADNDARTRRVDVDLQLVGRALDVDARHAGVREPLLELGPQTKVLMQQLGVVTIGKPSRLPGLVEPKTESVGMYFLTHMSTPPLPRLSPWTSWQPRPVRRLPSCCLRRAFRAPCSRATRRRPASS